MLWLVTKRVRPQTQAAKLRVAGLSLTDRVRGCDTWRELIEPLLLRIQSSQRRWFGKGIRMPPGCLPLEVFWARPTGRTPRGRPRTRWRDYTSVLGMPQDLRGLTEKRCCGEERLDHLSLLPPRPGAGYEVENRWKDGWTDGISKWKVRRSLRNLRVTTCCQYVW